MTDESPSTDGTPSTDEKPSGTEAASVALRIGVRFVATGAAGELFADAKAVEAAGADSLWIDAADGDPYVALAALAAVTWRVRLPPPPGPPRHPARRQARPCRAGNDAP